MRPIYSHLIALTFVLSFISTVRAQTSEFDAALRKIGLTRGDVRISRFDLDRLTNRARPSSVLAHLFSEPLQTKAFMQQVRADLLADLTSEAPVDLASPFWQGIK